MPTPKTCHASHDPLSLPALKGEVSRGKSMKKKIDTQTVIIDVSDLSDYLEYDFDVRRDCRINNCDSICRCSKIENVVIESSRLDYTAFDFFSKNPETGRNRKYEISEIEKYCVDKLIVLNGGMDVNNFDINVCNSFYGEEISGASFGDLYTLLHDMHQMLDLENDIDKVFFILEKEYSYLADIVKNCRNAEIVTKKPCEIKPSGNNSVKKNEDYIRPFEQGETIGIIKGNLLIDGNHRMGYAYAKGMEKENFRYVQIS